ncbi:hypothetical protein SH1V18_10720 [Vallitalea longa]|uniref:Uncharacterized protein n=1 Tax=Vallitalea longa TaxID=2936439 RepID=A0A9W6DEL9_9FIRM|nr:hypothetical protein [Vallitalea longa]GKX28592.1 hypothetical protein SH1V18_10720 [Vallitalea longa]
MKKSIVFLCISAIVILIIIKLLTTSIFDPKRLTPDDPTGKKIYYTMVDNSDVEKDESNDCYDYRLSCYSDMLPH